LVADINTTPTIAASSAPSSLVNIGGTLFFAADDGVTGAELWKSTGGPLAPGGTEMVKNINPASSGSGADNLTNVNGTLFLAANDGTHGFEPWQSLPPYDSGSTSLVFDVAQGNGGADASFPSDLTNINGTLLFAANDNGTTGNELWKATVEPAPPPPSGGGGASNPLLQSPNPLCASLRKKLKNAKTKAQKKKIRAKLRKLAC
jgi:ELWxxDGT repeat protein